MMIIKSNFPESKKIAGVLVHPGTHKYRELSLKNKIQRYILLVHKESGRLEFKTDEKLSPDELPIMPEKNVTTNDDARKPKKGIKKSGRRGSADSGNGALPGEK